MNNTFIKQVQLAVYLVEKFGTKGVPVISVLKMMFLADVYVMRNYAVSITNDTYYAMQNGPVASNIDNILEQNNEFLGDVKKLQYVQKFLEREPGSAWSLVKAKPTDDDNNDKDLLSEIDKKVLDIIFEKYGNYKWQKLVRVTHQYSAWQKEGNQLNETQKSKKMNMRDVFENDGDMQVSEQDIKMARQEYGNF